MSGTGQFRNVRGDARTAATSGTAREHLGDRLAAFVDGELGDDARERVLAHLATCDQCRAEAGEQRRLKNAVAESLPPAVSAGLLARLQGLPGCHHGDPGDPGGPGAAGPQGMFGRGGPVGDVFGRGTARSYLAPAGAPLGGFPVHEFQRTTSRGRRLAFAAAGAFSLAALALGAALPLDAALEGSGASEPAAGTATPLSLNRAAGTSSARPAVTPASITEPLLAPRGGRAMVAPAARQSTLAAGPSPSALPAAAAAFASVAPSAPATPAYPARSVAPAPLPLLGGVTPGEAAR